MPSETMNQSPSSSDNTPLPPPMLNREIPAPGQTQPLGQEVSSRLQTGDNPLDFVKKNLAALERKRVDPAAALAETEAKRAEETKQLAEKTDAELQIFPEKEESQKETAKTVSGTDDGTSEVPESLEPSETTKEEPDSAADNFRKVRKVLHETKTQLSTSQQELETTRKELERYKTGEVLPDALADKEAEIARLSKYEKILALKTSKEYQDKYVAPLTDINNKLNDIARDYNIPSDLLCNAVNSTNRAELNQFLSQNFDDVGALEVKQLITQAQSLQKEAQGAEQEPQTVLQQLLQQGEQARQERINQTHKELQTTVRTIWKSAFDELTEEGKAQELIYRADDPEHNKNIVDPIVKHAAGEFGKLIKDLVDGGLEKLSPAAGRALAKTFLLGSASAVAMETRENVVRHADELEARSSRLNKIYRPPVGSMAPGVETTPQDRRAMTPLEAGRSLINNVLAKKRA